MNQELLNKYQDFLVNPTYKDNEVFYYTETLLKDLEGTEIKKIYCNACSKGYQINNNAFPFYVEFLVPENETFYSYLSVFSKSDVASHLTSVADLVLTDQGSDYLLGLMNKTRNERKEAAKKEFFELVNRLKNGKTH